MEIPLVVAYGMPLVKHQVVMLQPSWILGFGATWLSSSHCRVENDVLEFLKNNSLSVS